MKTTQNKWQKLWKQQLNTKLKTQSLNGKNPNSIERKKLRMKRLRIGHSRLTHGFLKLEEQLPLYVN